MAVLIANNAVGNLSVNITATQTTVTLQAGQGARFPSPGANQWFPLTLIRPDGTSETVRCTARATDSLTVQRAQESTTGETFSAGDKVELRLTAAAIEDLRSPAGTVVMWSGSIASIPTGWALCNGANGTPDLRNRFIVGAGSTYNPGNTGGADTVSLSVAQMPWHNHSGSTGASGSHNHGGTTGASGSHSHTGSTGTAGAHGHTINGVGGHGHSVHSGGSHSHTASTGNAGTHSHGVRYASSADQSGYPKRVNAAVVAGPYFTDTETVQNAGDHTHSVTVNSGGAHGHGMDLAGEHTHTMVNNGDHTHSVSVTSVVDHSHSISSESTHTHTVTITHVGGGESHENRPPYYALAFIMKL